MTHSLQARHAFITDHENVRFCELVDVGYEGDRPVVVLDPIDGSPPLRWEVHDADRLRDVLARDDLTRRNGRPFVIGHAADRILGFASGPAQPPKELHLLVVFDLEREVLGAPDDDQPEWWLFDGEQVPRKDTE